MSNINMSSTTIVKADSSHVPSLATMLARSFHPVNPFIKEMYPDTPIMREWLEKIFTKMVVDDRYYVLVAVEATHQEFVIGNLILRLMAPGENDTGLFGEFELTEDHNREKWDAMIAHGTESRNAEKALSDEPSYDVDNFAVDHVWKGIGVGTALLKRACEMADKEGLQMSVQANGTAAGFYERQGFVEKNFKAMPGDVPYTEHMLLRPAKGAQV